MQEYPSINNSESGEDDFWSGIEIEFQGIESTPNLLSAYFHQGGFIYTQWALIQRVLSNEIDKVFNQLREDYTVAEATLAVVELKFEKELLDQKAKELDATISEYERLISEYERLVETEEELETPQGFNHCLALRDFLAYTMLALGQKIFMSEDQLFLYQLQIKKADIQLRAVYKKYAKIVEYQENQLWVPEEFWWRQVFKPFMPDRLEIPFRINAPEAKKVSLVGDFNGWDPQANQMNKNPEGVWGTICPLERGKSYAYKFVVDGNCITDTTNPKTISDGSGGKNSVIDLTEL